MGFLQEAIERLRRRPEQSPQEIIAALEKEFTGINPIVLQPYNYRTPAGEGVGPTFSMSREVVEISGEPSVSKDRGEEIQAHVVFKPAGPQVVLGLINYQAGEEIAPGHTLRFIFPEKAKKEIFTSSGNAQIYAKGVGDHRWIFNVAVSYAVPDRLSMV